MPATATRMLVLGVVQIFGPANGYQLRRELLSWGVESWARVNPGSIYSMLATLTKHGLVDQTEIVVDAKPVTVYRPTEAGTAEFRRLVTHSLRTVDQTNPTDFRAAMSFAVYLTREQFLEASGDRRTALATEIGELTHVLGPDVAGSGRIPPHVVAEIRLEHAVRRAELTWLEATIADVERGDLAFDGEPGEQWAPPQDDAGWRMLGEQRRYRDALTSDA